MARTGETWDGGHIRRDSKGRPTYYIRRRIGGVLYEVSTRCHTSRAAHEQLKRFEADPANYRPGNDGAGGAIVLDVELAAAFLAWSKAKGNSPKWLSDQRRALAWWSGRLGKGNLRGMPTARLVRELDGARGHRQKIATIKALCSWLIRERHTLRMSEDPTAGLSVPQARPAQWTTPKAIGPDAYARAREHLNQPWRDCLDVLAGTGWHFSELSRFVGGGKVETHPMDAAVRVLACPRTKRGEPLRTAVSDPVADAGIRLRDLAEPPDYWAFRRSLRDACNAAGLDEPIRPGHLRHSVATWAINSGAAPEAVAAFLHHQSPRTTQRFYATHAVALKVPTLA